MSVLNLRTSDFFHGEKENHNVVNNEFYYSRNNNFV